MFERLKNREDLLYKFCMDILIKTYKSPDHTIQISRKACRKYHLSPKKALKILEEIGSTIDDEKISMFSEIRLDKGVLAVRYNRDNAKRLWEDRKKNLVSLKYESNP